ncbi:serine/threonine-protein kinase Genghis Khan isoform X1 [Trichogramma pretiosum]|uniref:serine/threonine-protein kinase Genghis Khan isoform X1 n=1 Tax=Trichogramma pretiosum TaxID=7493 RepID=UPI0006C95978|nr:serine/threonine-protein kinase Genghis Khan isoform X1 [Trichogramma pretiosum]XP_014233233.1 serine/threonine-protein kinase Genghis Khan isoform X1 [Trichogramma pretiosum]XP_014233238.1 serine/threonine-protein kinase Genghis Khan isoform X1 [Trichogramma pretiosum]XP_014233247.1 serine/threonine-protein kinase Genghis Khan isoform X1 [Trichogramma pretiosum]XP_014233256.1 serine/threonine-protein kinase Genghis Khan isoform X1 [Trichogramma pretiosum]
MTEVALNERVESLSRAPVIVSETLHNYNHPSSNNMSKSTKTNNKDGINARLRQLEALFVGGPVQGGRMGHTFSIETLIDILLVLYDECCNSSLRREKTVSDFIEFVKPVATSIKNLQLAREDFEIVKVIGRGAFGEVCVVKMRGSDKVFAMKILNKWEMLKRAETACFREERDVLVYGDRRWITNLHYAFQDDNNLYLVMDYYCGGDLLTLLSKFEDRLPEDMARFYIAEMVLAIGSIHDLKYVHRDIKPDNVLLDANGHIRLADFGSCLRLFDDGTVQSNVAVGTPDYISPEILRAMEDGQGRYGPECDWWSLGVCMYEMLYGETPFYAESLVETYGKIMNHKNCFDFPTEDIYEVSEEAKDLMRKLICSSEFRLGQNGIDDFKKHPWFHGVDWEQLRNNLPPYVPEVSSPTDTSNFDVDDNDVRSSDAVPPSANSAFSALHLPFVGFSFTQGSCISELGMLPQHSQKDKSLKEKMLEEENAQLLQTVAELRNQISVSHASTTMTTVSPDSNNATRKLQDEINVLTKRNCELESQLKSLEVPRELRAIDGGDMSKIRELENLVRTLRAEKEEIVKEKLDTLERLKQQDKELKDALTQRKLAMEEYTEVTDKLSELRSQKQKLSRQVRDKEEELEQAMQKVDSLRGDIRKAEKLRRELEGRIEEAIAETGKERKLRERSEEYCKQMQEETEKIRQRASGNDTSANHAMATQEINRLKAEVEKLEVQYNDNLNQQQLRFNQEVRGLQEQLAEAETRRELLEREVHVTKEKLDNARLENITDSEETISELSRRHDRERMMLMEENKKLMLELDSLNDSVLRIQSERRSLEDEYEELRNKKEAIAQWEAQITEIIQWVSDEKDARGYLQALATKMTEELEFLKHSGGAGIGSNANNTEVKNWRNRRSQKLDKMELLNLQSSLQSEIQAKQAISEELTKTRSDHIAAQKELLELRHRMEGMSHDMRRKDLQIKDLQSRLDTGDGFLERPTSQMSYLEHFLKETSSATGGNMGGGNGSAAAAAAAAVAALRHGSIDSADGDVEDNRAPSITSSKSNLSELSIDPTSPLSHDMLNKSSVSDNYANLQHKPKAHQFIVRTFTGPTKCNHCTSLMVGVIRQGVVCETCGFACHVQCCEKVPSVCPVPHDQTKRPLGIDPTRGIGTAYEGYVKVPKMGGVKKGWVRQFVVVCDFKLFLYDISDRNAMPSVYVSQVLDMRDEEFSVSSVRDSDVIHATKKDIPCIFRITTSLLEPPGVRNHTLMLADTESEKAKWVVALSELHRILKRNNLPNTTIFRAKELLDNTLSLIVIKNVMSGAVIDPDRLVIGSEEGLFCLDLDRSEIARVGEGKKIHQLEYVTEEQLIVVLSGKQRHVRLVPVRALDGDEVEWIKVAETKGCIALTTGVMRRNPVTYCLCVAIKKQIASQVIIYEITRTKARHKRLRELMLPCQAQTLQILPEGRLCVGYASGFSIYSIHGEHHPISLVHPENGSLLNLMTFNALDAFRCIELLNGEYLLSFYSLAVYVDAQGRKSRDREIMYTAYPTAVSFCEGYLMVYSDTHIDVFDCQSGDWLQTLNVKKAKPLNPSGSLTSCVINDMPHVIYLGNIRQREMLNLGGTLDPSGRPITRPRRRFSLREGNRAARPTDRRSKMISAPTNFNHITHMGPGNGIQIQRLLDLPTTLETADQQQYTTTHASGHFHTSPQQPQPVSQTQPQPQQRIYGTTVTPPNKPAPLPPRHPPSDTRRLSSHMTRNPGYSPHNGSSAPRRGPAPPRPTATPPSLPRTPVDQVDSDSTHVRSHTPHSIGSIASLQDKEHVSGGSPRHSIASNNSSNPSTPPSPAHDHGSSSYDS